MSGELTNDEKAGRCVGDGGPAFPQGSLDAIDGYKQTEAAAHCGLSMRDYFAAKALHGIMASNGNRRPNWTAKFAYDIADAMLEARKAVQS